MIGSWAPFVVWYVRYIHHISLVRGLLAALWFGGHQWMHFQIQSGLQNPLYLGNTTRWLD